MTKDCNKRGSMTVELALLLPLILYLILSIVYILLLLYQYAYLQASLNSIVADGATAWGKIKTSSSPSNSMNKEEINQLLRAGYIEKKYLNSHLYWRFGIFDDKLEKKEFIKEYVLEALDGHQLLKAKDKIVDVEFKDYFVYKKLIVNISYTYETPIYLPKSLFKLNNGYKINLQAESVLIDAPETIRNTDFVLDLMDSYETTSIVKEKYFNLINDASNKIREFINQGDSDER
ncbi:TadE/TadG family type IV pilus assembly protein [Alkaliphilus peptidifermentans]|uniref:TadE-like protein n=1 Tax=Alkaliphilus peptidifermentans DSM 18978 TaxID=1120976 RepID=A0A1G5J9F4_9FIRM|nr:TadE/TadG family type IV pilus assembly protein [Alkaliphilus peptidifermentans]SCY84459.1 TadE-like protein [Alkaliphilus peptidifermentans DSM 18978]